ncbi:hypothetical protein GCM10027036_34780 [Flavihumibacter cheonanensis]|uniref:hypothetical protein n=1 Tax=Flavihumibacter cheonanensis TaxID=1442385 RepID=UPI001EF92444|nr:hypothetical protein [Flavihumibacter cheonanensis]MCG7753482.1 hypothetical protein [Flavihumibacter cheonanensis]
MVETQYSVIIALTSSLGTVILSKIADVLLTNRQFKQQLYKIYFERKITASEQIMGALNIMVGVLWKSKNIFAHLSKSENSINTEEDPSIEEKLNELNNHMEKFNSSYEYIIAVIPYYYDFEDITQQLIDAHDRILSITEQFKISNIENDSETQQNSGNIYNELSIQYNEMIEILNSAMKRIRHDAKNFELH